MFNDNTSSEKRVSLDMKISKLNHSLKNIKNKYASSYKENINYKNIVVELQELLAEQKKIDRNRYFINCRNIEDINLEVQQINDTKESIGVSISKKLSITEKNFLKEHNYDCEKDKYKIFSTEKSPENEFVTKWNILRAACLSKPLNAYYNDRDWND